LLDEQALTEHTQTDAVWLERRPHAKPKPRIFGGSPSWFFMLFMLRIASYEYECSLDFQVDLAQRI